MPSMSLARDRNLLAGQQRQRRDEVACHLVLDLADQRGPFRRVRLGRLGGDEAGDLRILEVVAK